MRSYGTGRQTTNGLYHQQVSLPKCLIRVSAALRELWSQPMSKSAQYWPLPCSDGVHLNYQLQRIGNFFRADRIYLRKAEQRTPCSAPRHSNPDVWRYGPTCFSDLCTSSQGQCIMFCSYKCRSRGVRCRCAPPVGVLCSCERLVSLFLKHPPGFSMHHSEHCSVISYPSVTDICLSSRHGPSPVVRPACDCSYSCHSMCFFIW